MPASCKISIGRYRVPGTRPVPYLDKYGMVRYCSGTVRIGIAIYNYGTGTQLQKTYG